MNKYIIFLILFFNMPFTYLWGLNPTFEIDPNEKKPNEKLVVRVKVTKSQKDDNTFSFTVLVIPNGNYKIHKKTLVLTNIYKDDKQIYSNSVSYTLIDKGLSILSEIPEGSLCFTFDLNKDYIPGSKIVIGFFNGSAIGPTYWFKLDHENIKTEKKKNPNK